AVQRDAALPVTRRGDGPLVVLTEEHHGCLEDAGEDQRLVDVALAGGPVAEVHQNGPLAAVALYPHGVARRVQGLRADDDGVEVEVVLGGVPAAVGHTPEERQQAHRVHSPAPGHTVLAVAGEYVVVSRDGPSGTDLRRLL